MAAVDRFLALYFRAQERRGSPRAASMEAREGGSGGAGSAEDADSLYVAAMALMGTLTRRGALTPRGYDVLRAVYLHLTPAHFSLVVRQTSVTASEIGPGRSPDPAADVQSWCDWKVLARVAGLGEGPGAAAKAREVWRLARLVVDDELRGRDEAAERLGVVGGFRPVGEG